MNGERAYEMAYKYAEHAADGAVVEESLVKLVADDAGNVIENQHAKAVHKLAEARRAREASRSAGDRAEQAAREAEHLKNWTDSQREQGRESAELVWGACIRETGLLIEEASGGAA